jgi:hypothetical protein
VLYHQELTERIIGLAIEVHRHSGPALLPVHDMQLQTYLRMSGLPVGLLFNFHAPRLKDGLRRFAG